MTNRTRGTLNLEVTTRHRRPPSTFLVFLLREYLPKSSTCLEYYQAEVSDEEPVKHLEKTVLEYIRSLLGFQWPKLPEADDLKIHTVSRLVNILGKLLGPPVSRSVQLLL